MDLELLRSPEIKLQLHGKGSIFSNHHHHDSQVTFAYVLEVAYNSCPLTSL
jgi:hypothetical protein